MRLSRRALFRVLGLGAPAAALVAQLPAPDDHADPRSIEVLDAPRYSAFCAEALASSPFCWSVYNRDSGRDENALAAMWCERRGGHVGTHIHVLTWPLVSGKVVSEVVRWA